MPTCASLFSGGGGMDLGLKQAGFNPTWGIEYDEKISDLYELNFGHSPYHDLLTANPRDFERVNLLHASPPCISFSGAKNLAQELKLDIQLAKKVCDFINYLEPDFFTLENVPKYARSTSFALITDTLDRLGYCVTHEVVDSADFGAPTNRSRLILRASEKQLKPLVKTHSKDRWVTWWEAISNIFDSLPDSFLTPIQKLTIASTPNLDLYLIQRVGYRNRTCNIRGIDRPCWTLLATLGDDRKGGNRNRIIDAVWGGTVKSLNARALARIQSFTDDYQIPPEFGMSKLCRAIGNSVPPILAQAIGESLLDKPRSSSFDRLKTHS
jgi:DNA (cytosine-5)-methyltransferase 1